MVTIARGWWSALEPTLLAFTVVVCGSVALPAHAHATVLGGNGLRGATGTNDGTAAADNDSLDGGDQAADAFLAAPIILTSDDDSGRPLVENDPGAVSTLRPARLAPRGPPDQTHSAYTRDFGNDQDSDVIVDDDDHDDDDDRDDGGATDLVSGAHAVSRGSISSIVLSKSGALFSFGSDDHSLRAPPLSL